MLNSTGEMKGVAALPSWSKLLVPAQRFRPGECAHVVEHCRKAGWGGRFYRPRGFGQLATTSSVCYSTGEQVPRDCRERIHGQAWAVEGNGIGAESSGEPALAFDDHLTTIGAPPRPNLN